MKIVVVFTCLLITCGAFCQTNDVLLHKYDQQFIYRYGSSYMTGGNKLSFSDLRAEFPNSSLSFDLYKRAKKDKTISIVLRLVSTAMVFGVFSGIHKNNSGTAYTFLGAQLVSGFVSIAFSSKSITETDRAIQIRNRELLFPGTH
jgi:hypothetical protein